MVSEPVKPTESEKPIERKGILDLNEAVDDMEEEVEYEEVEEEVEEEEEIEEEVVEEEEEEEIEEEVVEEEEEIEEEVVEEEIEEEVVEEEIEEEVVEEEAVEEEIEIEEEVVEEEIEIEEEEIEEEVVEEEEEEEIEEEVVEEEVAEEEAVATNGVEDNAKKDENESAKHAELITLPPHGSEVYVGGISGDTTEEDLKCFCESVGEVAEVRLIKVRDSSENKGYAFVTYRTKELAMKAIEDLNNTKFKGKMIKCAASQAKHRLFIGNIPTNWVEDDMKKAVSHIGPGVTSVQLMMNPKRPSRNRGYAFIEYYNTACAEYSRKKMSSPEFMLDDKAPTVSWADPLSGDSASNSQIKSVYVKHLPKNVTEYDLEKLFKRYGKITDVVLPPAKSGQENRFGFVKFAEGSSALKAVRDPKKYEIYGQVLGCSLAKRSAADKRSDTGSSALNGPLLPNYPLGYGLVGGASGTSPSAYAQPMAYGRAVMAVPNPGVAMVPMIDGRLEYILQQPGPPAAVHQRGGDRNANSGGGGHDGSSSGGRQSSDSCSWGCRFRPY